MSADTESALLAQALALQRAALAGQPQQLLRGKNFALLSAVVGASDEADLFRSAAAALGAHVAHVRASLVETSTAREVEHTARLLARLYDAVECQGMTAALVQRLGRAVDMPVYDRLASAQHPSARLADRLGPESPAEARRCYVLQAVLIGGLS
jgi:ornithine carbamoyltransferase